MARVALGSRGKDSGDGLMTLVYPHVRKVSALDECRRLAFLAAGDTRLLVDEPEAMLLKDFVQLSHALKKLPKDDVAYAGAQEHLELSYPAAYAAYESLRLAGKIRSGPPNLTPPAVLLADRLARTPTPFVASPATIAGASPRDGSSTDSDTNGGASAANRDGGGAAQAQSLPAPTLTPLSLPPAVVLTSAFTPAMDTVPTSEAEAPMSAASPTRDWHSAIAEKAGRTVVHVPLDHIDAHPRNPRIGGLCEERLKALEASLRERGGFAEFHAPIGRTKSDGRVEMIKGHHQVEAAKRAGLKTIPMWVVEKMDDDEALQLLAFSNVQEGLTPLEIAMHSYEVVRPAPGRKGLGLKDYAQRMGIAPSHLSRYRLGAVVFQAIQKHASDDIVIGCRDRAEHLAAIHTGPEE